MNTWGISGPAFLAIYGAALVAVAAVAWCRGGRDAGSGSGDEVDGVDGDDRLDQYEVALLTGGERLAVVVALVNLDHQGVLDLGDRLLRQLGVSGDLDPDTVTAKDLDRLGVSMELTLRREPAAGAHPVEAAVYQAVRAAEPRTVPQVVALATHAPVLAAIRSRLEGAGLLLSPEHRARVRRRWHWFLPLLVLGIGRVVAGGERGRPVLFLVALLAVTGVAMVVVSRRSPERTVRADRLLAGLRNDQSEPPSRTMVAGGASLGMALALAGTAVLWSSDPPLALAFGAEAGGTSIWRRGHGGGCGSGGSGSSGCGGGGAGGDGGGCGGGGCGGCGG